MPNCSNKETRDVTLERCVLEWSWVAAIGRLVFAAVIDMDSDDRVLYESDQGSKEMRVHPCKESSDCVSINSEVYSSLLTSYNKDEKHLKRILQILCLPPKYSTLRVNLQSVDMPQALKSLHHHFKEQCGSQDRSMYNFFPHPALPDCVVIENRGPYNVTELASSVAVDLSCGMAVLRGAHVFAQGILAAPKSLKPGDGVSVYACVGHKCLKGSVTFDLSQCLFVGNGVSAVSRTDLFGPSPLTRGLGIRMCQPLYEAPSLNDLPFPWAVAQNLPSIACVHALGPQPGETILDMCAAPGGKTSHIASLVGKSGKVIALEKSRERTKRLKQSMEDQGLACVECFTFDATNACSVKAEEEDTSCGPPFSPSSFDRILVDAPCSALGQRPCRVNHISLNQLKSFPVVQQKLLSTASRLLRPGGVMVYSTCTICREENEDQVSRLLAHCPDLALVGGPNRLGGPGLPCEALSLNQQSLVQRFDPSLLLNQTNTFACQEEAFNTDTIGFFVAKFRKKEKVTSVDLKEPPSSDCDLERNNSVSPKYEITHTVCGSDLPSTDTVT